jgi:hypothetical protein
MFSETDSTCKCGYSEPAGSAHMMTFITEVITEYIKSEGITSVEIGDGSISNINLALASHFLLPAIFINAIRKSSDLSAKLTDIPLTTVDDINGFYKKRVITTSSKIYNPALIILCLGETVSSAIKVSMENEVYAQKKVLCLDYLSPIGGDDKKLIIDYVTDNERYVANMQVTETQPNYLDGAQS